MSSATNFAWRFKGNEPENINYTIASFWKIPDVPGSSSMSIKSL